MIISPLSHFSAVKWVTWSETRQCGMPLWWMRWISMSMDSGFGRSNMSMKSRIIIRMFIYSCKKKAASFAQKKWSNVVNLPPSHWLVNPGYSSIPRAQYWSLLLVDLALTSRCGHVRLGELKALLMYPCTNPISTTMTTLLIGKWQEWLGRSLTSHRMDHPIYFITEFFLSWSYLLMSIYMGPKYLYIHWPFGDI